MADMNDSVDPLPILVVPDPILKARAKPVTEGDLERVRGLVPRMFQTMYRAPGIGLAAPQVGVSLRFAVVDLQPDDTHAPIVLINPAVVNRSEEQATRDRQAALFLAALEMAKEGRIRLEQGECFGSVAVYKGTTAP